MFSFKRRRGAAKKAVDSEREPVYDPVTLRDRLNRVMRRRLSDDVTSLFHKACLVADLETAEQVLALLTKMLDREAVQFARDRRLTEGLIARLTEELHERRRNQQSTAALPRCRRASG